VVLSGCEFHYENPEEQLPRGGLEGRILSAGSPLAGVSCLLEQPDRKPFEARTEASGVFRYRFIPTQPVADYTLVCRVTQNQMDMALVSQVTLVAGQAQQIGDLTLQRTGIIQGSIRLSGAPGHGNTRISLDRARLETRTDSSGAFVLPSVPAGCYRMTCEQPGYLLFTREEVCVEPGEVTEIERVELLLDRGTLGAIVIEDGLAFIPWRAVRIAIHHSAQATRILLSEDPTFVGSTWEDLTPIKNHVFSADGVRSLYARFGTAEGVEGPPVSDEIGVDTKPPTGRIQLDSAVSYVATQDVVVLVDAADEVSGGVEMKIGMEAELAALPWVPLLHKVFVSLPPGDGNRTIGAVFRDALGNTSEVVPLPILYCFDSCQNKRCGASAIPGCLCGGCAVGKACVNFHCVEVGLDWVYLKGDSFLMGSPEGSGFSDERPRHEVLVKSFDMLKTEVTVSQYRSCVEDSTCTPPDEKMGCTYFIPGTREHPVNCLDWEQAAAFCRWAGGALPAEAQWEFAARSRGLNLVYPWGNSPASCAVAVMRNDAGDGCGTNAPFPVCSREKGKTSQGLCDMAGNVWEWIEDAWHFDYKGAAPSDGSAWVQNPDTPDRVVRGGGYSWDADSFVSSRRNFNPPANRSTFGGFRCVRPVDPEPKCGPCPGPAPACTRDGKCVDDCAARSCGPSPIEGHDCGKCPGPTDTCTLQGQCVDDCEGRECGKSPVAGLECGSCLGTREVCSPEGRCADDCGKKTCGLSPELKAECGSCDQDQACVLGSCLGNWVSLPGGNFWMGSQDGKGEDDERPLHEVLVADFSLQRTEVSLKDYSDCVAAGNCTPPGTHSRCNWKHFGRNDSEYPVDCVSWDQAGAYCRWIGSRLPAEAEWEYAARSTGYDQDYPWGNQPASCKYAVMNEQSIGCSAYWTWPFCSKPAGNTQQGICDLSGNVAEWVQDWYDLNYVRWPAEQGTQKVVRGGGFLSKADQLRATKRVAMFSQQKEYGVGFRCARSKR